MATLRAIFNWLGRSRWILPTLVVACLGFAILCQYQPILNQYRQIVIITICINIILCVSLNLVNGFMGEFSVGHAGFMALGAYASAVMSEKWFPNAEFVFFPSVVFGGLVAATVGLALSVISFKTRGDYLAIITLAFLMMVKSGIENVPYLGGAAGFSGINRLTTVPWAIFWVVVTIWVIRNLIYSKFGRAIIAIREDEIAANAMGVRIREAKMLAFVVSSFFAGVAGALFAHQISFINPPYFNIVKSTEILVMVYLGGVASLAGSVISAILFTLLYQALQNLHTWRDVVMPLILVLLMLFRPRGIMGLRELVWFIPRRELTPRAKL